MKRETKNKEQKTLKEIAMIEPNGCIVSKSIYDKKTGLKWLYRDEAINEMDSGWRAFSESNDKDLIIIDIDTLISIEPVIKHLKDYPVGTDLEFHIDESGHFFTDNKTGSRLWF